MRPHRLHLNVTEKCNLRCIHCYWEEYGKNADPSLETIDGVFREFKELARSYHERGRHVVTLGGGEPTLRRDLEEIVSLAMRRRFKVRLVTNAVLVDEKRARSLRKAGLRIVQVSLDGACQATHDGVRGPGNWRRTMEGIEAFRKAGILVVLSYVLLPGINMDEAPLLLDLVRTLKVAGAKFARPVREGQAAANGIGVDGDYFGAFQRILEHARSIRYRRLLMFFDPLAHLLPIESPKLTAGLWGLATDLCQCNNTELVEVNGSSGDVYYCRIRAKLGNLRERSLADIWQSHPVLEGIRRKTPGGACGTCSAWKGCRGGCPAVVHGNTGQTLVQDTDCGKVRRQPSPLVFHANGYSHATVPAGVDALRAAGRKLKQAVFWLTPR